MKPHTKVEIKLTPAQYKALMGRTMEKSGGMRPNPGSQMGTSLGPQMDLSMAGSDTDLTPPHIFSGDISQARRVYDTHFKSGFGSSLLESIYQASPYKKGAGTPEEYFQREYAKYKSNPTLVKDKELKDLIEHLDTTSPVGGPLDSLLQPQAPQAPQDPTMEVMNGPQ